jgi:hypothetical protein
MREGSDMTGNVVTLPPRPLANLPADLSAQLSAGLATRNLINVIAELVRLPREQMVELSADQLDTMGPCCSQRRARSGCWLRWRRGWRSDEAGQQGASAEAEHARPL